MIQSQFPEIGLPNNQRCDPEARRARPARHPAVQSRPRHGTAHRGAGDQHHQDAAQRSAHVVPGHQRPARRLSLVGLLGMPRGLRQRSRPCAFGTVTRPSATRANRRPSTRRFRTTSRAIRSRHAFTRAIPSSQCMVCHMHQPNVFVNSYYGYIMWDYESDAPFMWPEKQRYPTGAEIRKILDRNPEEAAIRGKWGDPEFLQGSELAQSASSRTRSSPTTTATAGTSARCSSATARDAARQGRQGGRRRRSRQVQEGGAPHVDPRGPGLPVRRLPLRAGRARQRPHLRRGRGGDRDRLRRLPRHGDQAIRRCSPAGPASQPAGTDMSLLRTQDGRKRFEWREGKLYQRSALDPDKEWEVKLVKDTVNPAQPQLQRQGGARQAHAERRLDAVGARRRPGQIRARRRQDDLLHLPPVVDDDLRRLPPADPGQREDRAPSLRRRRDAQLRDLQPAGRARRHVPARPPRSGQGWQDRARALELGAGAFVDQHQSRAHLHPAAADLRVRLLVAGVRAALSAHRAQDRDQDLQRLPPSQQNDNNAIMAQLLLQGTNFVNFVGYNAWVGEEKQIAAVQVTEWDEPQAVIGSYLHHYAYPDWFAQHQERDLRLPSHPDARHQGCGALPAAARRIPVRCRRARRHARLRRRQHRQQGLLAEDHHRAVLAAGARTRTSPRRTRPASRCRPTSRSIRCATKAS